ncbi:MAG: CorA family divalent cation transporter [Asticcacaulis sp.]
MAPAWEQVFVRPNHALPANAVWIDLHNPSFDEEQRIKAQFGIAIPNREEIWRNHVTNHMYTHDGVAYMNAAILHKTDSSHPKTSAITFIAAPQCLVTIRYIYPTSFEHFQRRFAHHPERFPSADHILEGLMEEMVARCRLSCRTDRRGPGRPVVQDFRRPRLREQARQSVAHHAAVAEKTGRAQPVERQDA